MAAFQEFFHAIDKDNTGTITIDDLRNYMREKKYKAEFVTNWTMLFDPDHTGLITFEKYCEVLGLKPDIPKTREHSVKSGSEGQKHPSPTGTKPSTSIGVEEVQICQELKPKVEAEKPGPDNLAENQENTDSIRLGDEELMYAESMTNPKQTKREKSNSEHGEDLIKPSEPQSRKRKHPKSPPKTNSIDIESTPSTVESQEAVPAQEAKDSGMDIFDWLNTTSQQEITFDDDEQLVQSGVPSKEDSDFLGNASPSGATPTKPKGEECHKAKTDGVGEGNISTPPITEAEHPKKTEESSKRGKKTSESNKGSKKRSESSKVSESEVVPSVEKIEDSVIPDLENVKLEKEPKHEERTLEVSGSDENPGVSEAPSGLESKDAGGVEVNLNPSKKDAPECAESPDGRRGLKNTAKSKGNGKKKREKKVSESGESVPTHPTADEKELSFTMEEQTIGIPTTDETKMKESGDKESLNPLKADEQQAMETEKEITASSADVVGSAVPPFDSPDLTKEVEKSSEGFVTSQELPGNMHVPSPSKQKHKSPLPKSRRQKRTSKSGHSESSISEKREEKGSPDSLLNYLNVEDVSAPLTEGVTTTTTLAERFKGMHIAKKHPMQIIPSPTSVAETSVPPLEKLEPRSPWKPSESNQKEVNVEVTDVKSAPPPFNEEHQPDVEMEETLPSLNVEEREAIHGESLDSVDKPLHIIKKHPMQIISAPTNVQASAVPTVEKMESCTSEIPLRSEEERMDTEAVGVPASPPSKNERLEEEHQSFAAVVEQTVATEASPVVESLHIVKKHPMQIIPSPTTVPESSVTSDEKVEPQKSAKPLESNQEDGDAVVTGVASSSSPPVEHSDDQQPSTVEPEQTAQPLTEGKSETAEVDVTESLRIVQKHPMHIIPTPTNVLKSAAPLTSEEKLEVTQTAEAVPTTSKEKQNLVKSGAKSTKSIDKKRGKKTPITLPTIETTTVLETEPKTSPLPHEDTKAEAEPLINVEMDISPSTAEVVNSENLTTEHQEASGKASPSSLDKKRSKTSPLGCTKRQREKRVSGSESKETSSPTPEPTAQPIKQHQLSDVEKASSSPDRKEGNKSPLLPVEEKAMLSSVNVDVMQASPEGQTPPSISVKQRESRDSPKKGRRDKKSSESAKGGEKKSTDVEMTMPDSMLEAVEPQNLPAVHHEPSEEKSPSSSKKKANKNLLELSLESAEASIKVDEMQMLSGAPAKRSGGKEASPTKHHEKKISECVELEEKDVTSVDSAAVPIETTVAECEPANAEHQGTAKSEKKSSDSKKKRGKKKSESSPGHRKPSLEAQEPVIPPDSTASASKREEEEEVMEFKEGGAEHSVDVLMTSASDSPVPLGGIQEKVKAAKKSPTPSDKRRNKGTSESSSLNMEETADPLEAHEFHAMSSEHLKGKGSAIKRKRDKEPVGPVQTKEEEFSNIAAGTASSTMESPVPPNTETESPQEGQKPPTKKSTDNVEKGKKTKTKLLEASAKQKTSNQQRCSVSSTTKPKASKESSRQTTEASLEAAESGMTFATADLPEQAEVLKPGKRRRGKESKPAKEVGERNISTKKAETSTLSKDSDISEVK